MLSLFIRESWLLLTIFTITTTLTITRQLDSLQFLGLNASLTLILIFLKKLFQPIYFTWLGPYLGHSTNLKEMGSWAIITGSTDGIGLAYAKELARRGLNLVLISRTLTRLQTVAQMLESDFKIKTKIISMDFSNGIESYKKIEDEIAGLDIGTLINNVGMTYNGPSYFHEIEDSTKFINDIINTNILSVTMMTRMVLPQMIEKKKGVIVNIGSVSSVATIPWLSLYSSTKAYVETFTLALLQEYRDKGIVFQYLFPGYVATKMSKYRNTTFFVPSPETFAKLAVRTIGLEDSTAVWIPHHIALEVYKLCNFIFPKGVRNVTIKGMSQLWLFAMKRKIEKSKLL